MRHDFLNVTIRKEIEWLNDKEVTKFSEQRHKIHDFNSQLAYITASQKFGYLYQIWLGEKHIGNISAEPDPPNNTANMGILIGDKTEWGKGYGLEAWVAFMDFLFSCGFSKIEAGCMAENRAMELTCRRSGMAQEACIPSHFILDNNPSCLLLFGKQNAKRTN